VQARRRLSGWPRDHYGYRADDVRQVVGMLDETISELRAAAGETSFSVDLVAATADRVDVVTPPTLLAAPTAAESVAHAIAVAKVTDTPADKVSVLEAVVAAID